MRHKKMNSGSGRNIPDIKGMTSLKVSNISPETIHEDLKRLFEKFGEIGDVHIPRNRDRAWEIRGFAYVRFWDARDAKDAMEAMDGRTYENRELRVQLERYDRPEIPRQVESPESMEIS